MSRNYGGTMVANLFVKFGADTTEYQKKMRAAVTRMLFAAESLTQAGRIMSTAITAPMIAVGVASLKTAMEFEAAMNDDLNVAGAMGEVFEMLKELNPLIDAGEVGQGDRDTILDGLKNADRVLGLMGPVFEGGGSDEDAQIDALVAERTQARQDRDFSRADEIRDDLQTRGIVIEDGPEGTIWRKQH